MEPRIQYCTAPDGVNLAFCTEGEGPPLVYMPTFGVVGHLQVEALMPRGRQMLQYLTERMQVIRYDRRGQGLSDREPADDSLDAQVSDLNTILDRIGVDRVALYGQVFAGPVAIAFAARHPERVSHLILINTVANMPEGYADSPRARGLAALLEHDFETFTELVSRLLAGWTEPEIGARIAAQARAGSTPEGMRQRWRIGRSWDASDLMPRIVAPTLVIETPDAPFAEKWIRASAVGISGAQFRQLDQVAGESVAQAVCEFVTGEAAPPPAPIAPALSAGTAIVLFADIVDSTALTEQLGDAAFRARATRLDVAMRLGMRECGGVPVEGKVLGDGVMAVFTSSRQAIDGARRCLAAADGTGLALHLGIHAGDVIHEHDNVYGGTVNIASRICGLCEPGEILVSDVVRGMARSSAGVEFEDRGEQEMKGVGEPVRVYAVRAGA